MLDPLYYAVSAVMWVWHQLFGFVLGPSSGAAWALSVVFLVITLRALLIKPVLAQMRSGRAMRALAPQIAELRARHAGDPTRLAQETRALQSEHGVSLLGGCLPTLLQLPVFLGLLHVLHSFNRPGLTFEQNAAISNYVFAPDEVRSFLEARLFGTPLSAYLSMPQELLDSYGAHVDRLDVALLAVPLMLLAAVATHFSARHSLTMQPQGSPATSMLRWTPWIFPLGALVGGAFFPFPIAILLYWLTNNVWTLAQQRLVHRHLEAAGPPKIAVKAAGDPPPGGAAARPPAKRPGARPLAARSTAVRPDAPHPAAALSAAGAARPSAEGGSALPAGSPPGSPADEPPTAPVRGRGGSASAKPRRHASGHRPSRRRR